MHVIAGVTLVGVSLMATVSWSPPASATVLSLAIEAGTGSAGSPQAGAATASRLNGPNGVAVDGAGDVYIADTNNSVIEKVTPTGVLSIVAGTGTAGLPTPGTATQSDLNYPSSVAVDSNGNLYIADTNNDAIEKVTAGGTLSIFAGIPGQFGFNSNTPNVQATSYHLYYPSAVAVDGAGNVYIGDSANNVVDKVTPSGVSNIVAGIIQHGGWPTAGAATSSNIDVGGLAVDSAGNLYIGDSGHNVIEKVTTGGTLSIFAGINHSTGAAPTPGTATSSHLNNPNGVAVDSAGDVYIADTNNNVVEEVSTSGTLSIMAGTGTPAAPTVGTPTSSALNAPGGVAVDGSGDVSIADTNNNLVEGITPASSPVFTADTPATTVPSGTPYSYTFTASGSPTPSFAVASGSLPAGLTLNTTTGVLSGSPTASGTFVIAATNGGGSTNTPVLTITVTSVSPGAPVQTGGGLASTSDGTGYWTVSGSGVLSAHGTAPMLGSENGAHLAAPVIAVHGTNSGGGYWLVARDGGVFTFGDARFFGSMAGRRLNAPVVGMATTPDGGGYWLVASDGGVFAFGDAVFLGSMASRHLNTPVVGMAVTPDGSGYWLVASDGGVFAFGGAAFHGSMGGHHLNGPVVGVAATPDGGGYWLVASDGGVFTFGDAVFHGSLGSQVSPVPFIGMIDTGATGYQLVDAQGSSHSP